MPDRRRQQVRVQRPRSGRPDRPPTCSHSRPAGRRRRRTGTRPATPHGRRRRGPGGGSNPAVARSMVSSSSSRWAAAAPSSSSKRTARIPRGKAGRWPSRSGSPTNRTSGIRGTMPSEAYSPFEIGWALSVQVASVAVPARRHDLREEPPTEAALLDAGQDEQHRQEPEILAPDRRRERDHGRRAPVGRLLGHDEPVGIVRLEVGVQPQDRGEVLGDVGLVQRPRVVVDRVAPDAGARDQVVGRRPTVGDACGRLARGRLEHRFRRPRRRRCRGRRSCGRLRRRGRSRRRSRGARARPA